MFGTSKGLLLLLLFDKGAAQLPALRLISNQRPISVVMLFRGDFNTFSLPLSITLSLSLTCLAERFLSIILSTPPPNLHMRELFLCFARIFHIHLCMY